MKTIRVIRIISVIFSMICGAYTAFAMYSIWGDKLLYYNSKTGYILSVSYKWTLLLFLIFIAADILLTLLLLKKKKDSKQTGNLEK